MTEADRVRMEEERRFVDDEKTYKQYKVERREYYDN